MQANTARQPSVRGWSTLTAHLTLVIVIGVHLALIVPSLGVQRLWEDEAFNLTVPLNLVAGLGYTSDGTLSGSMLTPFDVRISTGPVVLLPAALGILFGADPVIAGRFVAVCFWLLLVAGLAVLGRRIAGPWGSAVAALVPATLHTFQGNSPIQGPADVLGEPAAAALIVWALVLLQRRPLLAALIAGLAIQTKFIALLALPALAVGLLVGAATQGAFPPVRRWFALLWRPALIALLPTVLYEVIALTQLGLADFTVHARQFVAFLLSSGQDVAPTSLFEKLDYMMASWFVPGPVMWAVWGLATLLIVVALRGMTAGFGLEATAHVSATESLARRELLAIAVVSVLGLVIYLAWWGTASHTPLWIRHPAPALLAFTGVLAAFAVRGLTTLAGARGVPADPHAPRVLERLAAATLALGCAVLLVVQSVAHLSEAYAPRVETLQSQRVAASELAAATGGEAARNTWLAADPWGSAVNIVLLTGAHIGLADAPSMAETLRVTSGECAEPGGELFVAGGYALCIP